MVKKSTSSAATAVSMIFTLSALLGFAREIVLAGYVGAGRQMDALIVAMIIPSFFNDLLGEAVLAAAVVPVFVSFIAPFSNRKQREIIGSALSVLSLFLVPFALLATLAAPMLVRFFVPGFGPESARLTVSLMRIMMPSVILLGLANLVTGVLYAVKKFGPASAASAMWNLGIITATIPLAGRYGVAAPAIGILIGTSLQLAVMVPPLVRSGLFPRVSFNFKEPALARIWTLFWPVLGGSLVVQILTIADKIIASFLPEGSIAAISYADKIAGGPARIFAMSVSVVLFPSIANKVSEKAADLADTVSSGIATAATLTLPWAAIFIALREPVVAVLLQRGAFDAHATSLVAAPMAIYCLGEFSDGTTTMLNNAFYSHESSRVPAVMNVVAKVVRIAVVLAFVRLLSYKAIALGSMVGMNFLAISLTVLLRRKIPDLKLGVIASTIARISIAAALGGLAAWLAYRAVLPMLGAFSTITGALAITIACIPALSAYGIVAHLLGVREIGEVQRRIFTMARERLARSRAR